MLLPAKVNSFFVRLLAFFGYKLLRINVNSYVTSGEEILSAVDVASNNSDAPFDKLQFGGEALQYLVANFEFQTVLDIGSGEGCHSELLNELGKTVTSIDYGESIYFKKKSVENQCISADYSSYKFNHCFDAVWASHVLEHQLNPNIFLKKIHADLKEGGVLAITVPPLKHEIVGGHVTLWNAGLLLYQLVMAGFNCREVAVKSYGYNISVILRKKSINNYPKLTYDNGDIKRLSEYFPEGFSEPFDGDIDRHNWH